VIIAVSFCSVGELGALYFSFDLNTYL